MDFKDHIRYFVCDFCFQMGCTILKELFNGVHCECCYSAECRCQQPGHNIVCYPQFLVLVFSWPWTIPWYYCLGWDLGQGCHIFWWVLGMSCPRVVLFECVHIFGVVFCCNQALICQHICPCSSIQVWYHKKYSHPINFHFVIVFEGV